MRTTLIKAVLPLAALVLVTGCSKETPYYMLHDIAKQNCRNIVNPEERRSCEAQHNKTYREYEAERYSSEAAE
jgi:hypothetical protein